MSKRIGRLEQLNTKYVVEIPLLDPYSLENLQIYQLALLLIVQT